uniref:tetratricopeptide repeat protein n=1 Tax=Phenylobacterium sp. TaxID=1871053 RepID=UPI002FDEC6B5
RLDQPLILADAGDAAYLDAVGLINEGRYEVALARLDAARAAFGPHPDVLTYQGFAHRKLGRFDLAEVFYRQALAAAPDHRGALEYYGELKVERGDMVGARRMLARLERACTYGCAEAETLRSWIDAGGGPER